MGSGDPAATRLGEEGLESGYILLAGVFSAIACTSPGAQSAMLVTVSTDGRVHALTRTVEARQLRLTRGLGQ